MCHHLVFLPSHRSWNHQGRNPAPGFTLQHLRGLTYPQLNKESCVLRCKRLKDVYSCYPLKAHILVLRIHTRARAGACVPCWSRWWLRPRCRTAAPGRACRRARAQSICWCRTSPAPRSPSPPCTPSSACLSAPGGNSVDTRCFRGLWKYENIFTVFNVSRLFCRSTRYLTGDKTQRFFKNVSVQAKSTHFVVCMNPAKIPDIFIEHCELGTLTIWIICKRPLQHIYLPCQASLTLVWMLKLYFPPAAKVKTKNLLCWNYRSHPDPLLLSSATQGWQLQDCSSDSY